MLKNGIPSLSTFSWIASGTDGELLALAFTDWIGTVLSTRGVHIVIDGKALRATETILRMIEEKKGYFVQQIKRNCPATYQEIQDIFEETAKETDPGEFSKENKGRYSEYSSCEKNRERVEYREIRRYTNDDAVGKIRKELPFICSITYSFQVRIPKEVDADGNDVTADKETFLK